MSTYYFAERYTQSNTAGSKARNDVEKILRQRYKPLFPYDTSQLQDINGNLICKLKVIINQVERVRNVLRVLRKTKKNDRIIIQYPLIVGYNRLLPLISKLRRTTIIIHDLRNLRGQSILAKNEETILGYCEYIIVHNKKMAQYLQNKGVKKEKLYCLEIFDYLSDDLRRQNNPKEVFCYAGNLFKSSFIYELPKAMYEMGINVYGENYEEHRANGRIRYKGVFNSEEIHKVIVGKYGVIWDGPQSDACVGAYGEYLKYNNPHKFSMYIAAGIPVITWRKAAIADFVEKEGIGILVNGLDEVENVLSDVTEERYQAMLERVMDLQKYVINGAFLERQLNLIEEKQPISLSEVKETYT